MPDAVIETLGFDDNPCIDSIAEVTGNLTSQSSSHMGKKFQWLAKVYVKKHIRWSPGHLVNGVGVDEKTIKHYLEHQAQQDSG
jgi:REP element-mobilizing transposase RayT